MKINGRLYGYNALAPDDYYSFSIKADTSFADVVKATELVNLIFTHVTTKHYTLTKALADAGGEEKRSMGNLKLIIETVTSR